MKKNFFRISFAIIFIFFGLAPLIARADIDQRCFTKTVCNDIRKELGAPDKDGLYTGKDAQTACGVQATGKNAANVEVGFCLPVGESTTKISFGGKQTFTNFGEFIQYMYRYGMWLAGIVAVALIVISGAQWAASGGNSDMISSAKTRIGGAVSGLILLALSYTLLNTINPYLVTLRLPQVWLINELGMAPPFCSDINNGTKIAYFSKVGDKISDEDKAKKITTAESGDYPIDPTKPGDKANPKLAPVCGHNYLVEKTGGQSCMGNLCSPNHTCTPFSVSKDEKGTKIKSPDCVVGQIVLNFSINSLQQTSYQNAQEISGFWTTIFGATVLDIVEKGWLQQTAWVYPVCELGGKHTYGKDQIWGKKGTNEEGWFEVINAPPVNEFFVHLGKLGPDVHTYQEDHWECPNKSKLVGYFFKFEVGVTGNPVKDANLYVGYDKTAKRAVAGTYPAINAMQNFFPIAAMGPGIFSDVPINQQVINAIFKDKNSITSAPDLNAVELTPAQKAALDAELKEMF